MKYNHLDMLPEQAFKPVGSRMTLEGGGGGKGSTPSPVFTPPPAAPAVEATSTQTLASTPADELKKKQDALRMGAKALQIPTTTGSQATTQVGTGA